MTSAALPFGRPFFAMDTAFGPGTKAVATYPLHVACAMLSELGYDQTYLTVFPWVEPADAALLRTVPAEHGLGVAGVYVILDMAAEQRSASLDRALRVVAAMPDGVDLETAIICSDETVTRSDAAGDAVIAASIRTLADRMKDKGASVALYPHVNFWLEVFGDAVRLARHVNHAAVGVCFCGYHWYVADDQPLHDRLADALPLLRSVNLCGVVNYGEASAIRPLDEGQMDNFAVLAALKQVGYTGRIGIQGWGVGGDVYNQLRRSRDAYTDILTRLDRHPDWSDLNPKR